MNIFKKLFKGANQSIPIRILKSSTKKITKTDSNNNQTVISKSNELIEWNIYENKIEIKKENSPPIVLDTLVENQLSHPPQLMIYRVYEASAKGSGISVIIISSPLLINVNKYLEERIETYNIIYDSW